MEEMFSSETSVDFQRITRPYIPEDNTIHFSLPYRTVINFVKLTVYFFYISLELSAYPLMQLHVFYQLHHRTEQVGNRLPDREFSWFSSVSLGKRQDRTTTFQILPNSPLLILQFEVRLDTDSFVE
jgi:hypothetical protein